MTSQTARRTAIMAAIHTHYLTNGTAETLPEADYALVTYSPIIAGALIVLMSGILLGVCLLMREKRKRIQEAVSLHNLPWIENLQVFTVTGQDAATGIFLPPSTPNVPSPPPAYESVVTVPEKAREAEEQEKAAAQAPRTPDPPQATPEAQPSATEPSDDLPTYEAAVRMEGNM